MEQATYAAVRQLLKEGHDHAWIADLLKLPVTQVERVAVGKLRPRSKPDLRRKDYNAIIQLLCEGHGYDWIADLLGLPVTLIRQVDQRGLKPKGSEKKVRLSERNYIGILRLLKEGHDHAWIADLLDLPVTLVRQVDRGDRLPD